MWGVHFQGGAGIQKAAGTVAPSAPLFGKIVRTISCFPRQTSAPPTARS